ncbi:YkgJ family cysteine cluster protein [Ruegeria sp. HKCCD4884]|uniref:YkgJ family cysteine cluster protein n=1 Tax=Ruegeria sp. HKCCD4884 TaxID=2683022 RepID=UPI0014926EFD|nr:YkgJ family cysteine cluster protein [Ruegeria sp. HKCCD4884]
MAANYDCSKCPGFCCTYDEIDLLAPDVTRLCSHLDISEEKLISKYTKFGMFSGRSQYPLKLKHKVDRVYKKICVFFDQDLRVCTVYDARPKACRAYPHGDRCGYYDFLSFERNLHSDEDHIPST